GAGLLAVGVLVCALAAAPRWRHGALGRCFLAWTALVLLGAARADDPVEAARLALSYLSAPAYGLAVAAWLDADDHERLLRWTARAAWVPVTGSLLERLAAPDLVLHDYPRWLGGYASHHAHALAMALFVLLGLLRAGEGRRAGLAL